MLMSNVMPSRAAAAPDFRSLASPLSLLLPLLSSEPLLSQFESEAPDPPEPRDADADEDAEDECAAPLTRGWPVAKSSVLSAPDPEDPDPDPPVVTPAALPPLLLDRLVAVTFPLLIPPPMPLLGVAGPMSPAETDSDADDPKVDMVVCPALR